MNPRVEAGDESRYTLGKLTTTLTECAQSWLSGDSFYSYLYTNCFPEVCRKNVSTFKALLKKVPRESGGWNLIARFKSYLHFRRLKVDFSLITFDVTNQKVCILVFYSVEEIIYLRFFKTENLFVCNYAVCTFMASRCVSCPFHLLPRFMFAWSWKLIYPRLSQTLLGFYHGREDTVN